MSLHASFDDHDVCGADNGYNGHVQCSCVMMAAAAAAVGGGNNNNCGG